MENKELQVVDPPQSSPAEMLTAAIEKGIDADGIVKLAEVFERMEARRAEQAFTRALLHFQENCPPILKTEGGIVRDGKAIPFAPLWKIAKEVDPVLHEHGLSYTWDTDLGERTVTSICRLKHVDGHSTETRFSAPISPAPKMSDMHAAASAAQFANRLSLQYALGIVTTALKDDDGRRATEQRITPEQLETLTQLINEYKPDMAKLLAFAGVERLEDLPQPDYDRVHGALLQHGRRVASTRKGESL